MVHRLISRRSRTIGAVGAVAVALLVSSCGGGGGGSSTPSTPIATPTPTPAPTSSANLGYTPGPNAAVAFTCPSNDSSLDGTERATSASAATEQRHLYGFHRSNATTTSSSTRELEVLYNNAAVTGTAATQAVAREQSLGAQVVRQLSFSNIGRSVHYLSVPSAQMSSIEASLRTQSGVLSVSAAGARRVPLGVSGPYWTNDPYFNGFQTTVAPTAGSTAPPATYHASPYDESAAVPGQWNMHAIKLEDAFAYSQANNGSSVSNANALGSSSVKIAIVDSGEDVNHPELASKIAYQKCYITNEAGTAQSTSNYATDSFGHGTDVAGLAAAATNNAFGFTGAGGNVVIYGYRVFPTYDDNCNDENTNDPQCGADPADIASAINDAVAQGVNVISMSIGGNPCGSGPGYASNGDDDVGEGNAIINALAKNVIVVAASGNSGGLGPTSPACDPGVIAVGATGLADGTANGSGMSGGSASAPIEYVTSYTQYGSPQASPHSASAWGIVAPGGDATGSGDNDELHWIDDIWTTTPYQSSASDQSFLGECTDDYPNYTSTKSPVDCRTLIAGTSMATPLVAGVAALVLSVNSSYQSPTAMKQLLCQTADNIGTQYPEGCGRLNAYNAMAVALGDPAAPTPVP